MKLLVEILLAIFLHPIAWVLCVINIVGRTDMGGLKKLLWIIITFVWGIGPILYVLLAGVTIWCVAEPSSGMGGRAATRALVLGLLCLPFGILAPFATWAGAGSL